MRKRVKKRRGFWGWLMGEESSDRPPGLPAPVGQVEQETGPIPLEGHDELPQAPNGYSQQPCPICGGKAFRWDWLESGLYGLGKGPAAAEQHKWIKIKTRFGEFVGLRARLCENCGHVDLFVPKTEESKD